MIEYVALYDTDLGARIVKRFSSESGETFDAELNLLSKTEIPEIPDSVIEMHINNLLDYCSVIAGNLELFPPDVAPYNSWPIKNYAELMDTLRTCVDWWNIMYFRDEPTVDENVVFPVLTVSEEEHIAAHGDEAPHYHDEQTGETIYTDTAVPHDHSVVTDQTEASSA